MNEGTKKALIIGITVVAVVAAAFSIYSSTAEPVGKGVPLPPTKPGYGTDGVNAVQPQASPNPSADPDRDEKTAGK